MNTIRYSLILLFGLSGSLAAQQMDSLDIMIGQMIMVGYHGQNVASHPTLLDDIKNGTIGGVILYEKNIDPDKPWVKLKREIELMQMNATIPLWLSIDQEGGRVNRLKPKYGFPPSVTAEYLGLINNVDSTRFYAELTAATLKGLGFNVNFAPDVDLAINPENPVIAGKDRSYSIDPSVVVAHSETVVKAHQAMGIVTTLKHFPGHGSSTSDTHLGMADVTKTWQEIELTPYREMAARNTLDAVMTAHIINKNLDEEGYPATLSKNMVQGILRDKYKFNGVIFSDDMHMRAISDHYGLKNALSLSINAGLDVLLFSNNITKSNDSESVRIHRLIRELVVEEDISVDRIRESYNRIMTLKRKYLQLQ